MRPASAIPEALMMMAGSRKSLSFIECANSRMYVRFSIPKGFSFSRRNL